MQLVTSRSALLGGLRHSYRAASSPVCRASSFQTCPTPEAQRPLAARVMTGHAHAPRVGGAGCQLRGVAARAGGGAEAETDSGYWTLQSYVLYESEVKKSKFIVHAWPVSSPAEAMELIKGASDPSASHNCFAYRIGDEFRSSDDGEPGGTAGKPIQTAIDGEGLDRVAVLVTRFFGGIKLGAGGLVRAYGGAAQECLKLAPRAFAKAQVEVVVEASYDELGTIYSSLDMHACTRLAEDYGSSGTVSIRALVDADKLKSLQAAVADGTRGKRKAVPAAEAAAAGTGSA